MPALAKYLNIINRGIVFSRPFIPHPNRALNKYEKALLELWIEGSINFGWTNKFGRESFTSITTILAMSLWHGNYYHSLLLICIIFFYILWGGRASIIEQSGGNNESIFGGMEQESQKRGGEHLTCTEIEKLYNTN